MTDHAQPNDGYTGGSPTLLIIGRLGASALALISSPIIARSIGPVGRGETAAALALFYIVPVALGLGVFLEVRRQASTSDGHAVIRTARMLVALSTTISVGLAGIAYYTVFSGFSGDGRLVASIGIALAPLSTSWAIDVSVLIAHRRYRGVLVIQMMQATVFVVLIVLIWSLGKATVATVLAANIAGTSATFLTGLVLVRVSIRGERVSAVTLLRRGITFYGSAIAEIASNKADQVLALPLIGAYQAGLYSVAATVASVPLAIGQALAASYFSPIARAEGRERRFLQGEAIRAAIAIALMAIPLIALLAWATIPLVFGAAFASSVPVTMISLVGSAGLLAGYVASMSLAADGQGIKMTIAQAASLVCGIAGLAILGPPLGANGAAIASTLGYAVLLTVLLVAIGIPPRRLIPRRRDFIRAVKRLRRD